MALGAVAGPRWRTHCEGAVDARAHEIGTGQGLATLATRGEGEGRGGVVVDRSHGGVGSVGDAATLGVRAPRGRLARFGALEARRGLAGVLAFVPRGAQRERRDVGRRRAVAVPDMRVAHGVAGGGTAQSAHEAAGARGGVGRLGRGVGRCRARESRTGHHGRCGDAAASALLAPALVAFGGCCCGTGEGAVTDTASRLVSIVGVLLLVAEFLFVG